MRGSAWGRNRNQQGSVPAIALTPLNKLPLTEKDLVPLPNQISNTAPQTQPLKTPSRLETGHRNATPSTSRQETMKVNLKPRLVGSQQEQAIEVNQLMGWFLD